MKIDAFGPKASTLRPTLNLHFKQGFVNFLKRSVHTNLPKKWDKI